MTDKRLEVRYRKRPSLIAASQTGLATIPLPTAVPGSQPQRPNVRMRQRPGPAPIPPLVDEERDVASTGASETVPAKTTAPASRTRGVYDVGYKKPPKEHRFKPGNNANPRGRPKGVKNLSTLVQEALNEKVTVQERGRSRKMTKGGVGITRSVNKFVETGDPKLLLSFARFFPPVAQQAPEPYAPDPGETASQAAMLNFLESIFREGGSLLSDQTEPSPGDDDAED